VFLWGQTPYIYQNLIDLTQNMVYNIDRLADMNRAEVVIIYEGVWTMGRTKALVLTTEIDAIRTTMYEVSKKVENLTDPLLVQLSQILDEKLNKLDQIRDCA
jgi:hypothetical protein